MTKPTFKEIESLVKEAEEIKSDLYWLDSNRAIWDKGILSWVELTTDQNDVKSFIPIRSKICFGGLAAQMEERLAEIYKQLGVEGK